MPLALLLTVGILGVVSGAEPVSQEEYDTSRFELGCQYETRCQGPKKDYYCQAAPGARKAFERDKQRNQLMRSVVQLDRADWEACASAAPTADCKAYPTTDDFILQHPKCGAVQDYLHHKGKYTLPKR